MFGAGDDQHASRVGEGQVVRHERFDGLGFDQRGWRPPLEGENRLIG